MNKLNKFLILTLIFGLAFISYKVTHSFYNDSEVSTNNIFQAAAVFATPSPTPIPGITNHVVISEVQITGGPGNTTNDFIELYNPTNSSINLGTSNYRLVKRTGSSTSDINIVVFSSSHIIPAHGFFLWANSGFTTITATPDVTSTDTLAASNSIAIREGAEGPIIDALSWNSAVQSHKEGTEFSPDPGANASMERKALSTSTQATMEGGADASKGNGFDLNDNSTDFVLRTTSQPQNSSSATEAP